MNARRWLMVGLIGALAACGADTDEQPAADAATDAADAPDAAANTAQPTPEEAAAAAEPPAPETMSVETGADTMAASEADEEEPTEPEAEPSSSDRLYTIQIAAYLDSADAERLVGVLRGRGLPIWTARATVDGTDWTRVRIGASPSLGEARELGSWITREYESAVWVAPVDPALDSVPADAVDLTREFLGGRD